MWATSGNRTTNQSGFFRIPKLRKNARRINAVSAVAGYCKSIGFILLFKHVSGAEIGAQLAENRVSGSGAVSERGEIRWSGAGSVEREVAEREQRGNERGTHLL